MPNENQQTTTPAPAAPAPAANDTKTSWNFGDFAKGFETPFTKNPDNSLNLAGALLIGGGSGLASWVLSRMLGIKGGPSIGISILSALAGAHGSLAMQSGGDIFNFDYLKGLMDKNRADNGVLPPEEKTKQERFQEKLREQNQIDALNKLTSNKSPEQLTQLQEALGASGGDLDNSVLGQLSDDEKAAIMSGETIDPAIIQKVEDARNRALEIRSLGRELKDVPEEDWLDPEKNLIYNVMLNEFNGFRGNSKVRGQNGRIDLNKALVEMENSGNPLAVESVRRYRQALQNHTNQLINNKADAEMRREIEEANDRRRYPEKYVSPVATQGYGPEYREMLQPSNIVPNRGPSGFDPQNMSPHVGEFGEEIEAFGKPVHDMTWNERNEALDKTMKKFNLGDKERAVDLNDPNDWKKPGLPVWPAGLSSGRYYPNGYYEYTQQGQYIDKNLPYPYSRLGEAIRDSALNLSSNIVPIGGKIPLNEAGLPGPEEWHERIPTQGARIPSYSGRQTAPTPLYEMRPLPSPQPPVISKELPIGGNVSISPANQAWADVIQRHTGQMSPIPSGLR